jgi:hypothetical protein
MIAAQTIQDMSNECLPELICGWNAVWFTFQACMVPLVSLFSDASLPTEAQSWQASVETALGFLERSKPWSISAKRSMDAVSRLYQAYRITLSDPTHFPSQHQYQHQHQHLQQHQQHQEQFSPTDMEGAYDYATAHDVATLSMGHAAAWGAVDASVMGNLSGFWDDMMWDTNSPDILDAQNPFGPVGNEYEYQTRMSGGNGAGMVGWMQGH